MKIELCDLQHVIGQIKRASPPTTKEAYKFLNNLLVLMERNTIKCSVSEEAVLSSKYEALHSSLLELCFLRRSLAESYAEEFSNASSSTAEILQKNSECLQKEIEVELVIPDWHLAVGCSEVYKMLPELFSKLNSAKDIINDSLEAVPTSEKTNADAQYELYFASLSS